MAADRAAAKRAFAAQPHIRRRSALYTKARKFGMTPDVLRAWFVAQWVAQGGRCAVCAAGFDGAPEDVGVGRAAGGVSPDIDHDHTTGALRGLLCRACNIQVGWLEKDRKRVELARLYLAGHTPIDIGQSGA